MTLAENLKRIHPLVAVAAVSVTLFSAVGIAAITGFLPNSQGANREASVNDVQSSTQTSRGEEIIPSDELAGKKHATKAATKSTQQNAVARTQQTQGQGDKVETAQRSPDATGASTQPAHKPAAQNSPIGIGVGAVIGGVLGNQIGSGDGKTLATIAGAIGGGYIGNEVAKSKP